MRIGSMGIPKFTAVLAAKVGMRTRRWEWPPSAELFRDGESISRDPGLMISVFGLHHRGTAIVGV